MPTSPTSLGAKHHSSGLSQKWKLLPEVKGAPSTVQISSSGWEETLSWEAPEIQSEEGKKRPLGSIFGKMKEVKHQRLQWQKLFSPACGVNDIHYKIEKRSVHGLVRRRQKQGMLGRLHLIPQSGFFQEVQAVKPLRVHPGYLLPQMLLEKISVLLSEQFVH